MDEQVEPVRHSLAACGELYGWIRQYQDIHVDLKDDVNPASCLLMQIGHRLLFVLSGSLEFIDVAAGRSTKVAQAALPGASTRPAFSLRSTGQLRLFVVTFQSGVLHWLSGVNTSELTNTFVDAAAVFGDSIAVLADRRARAIDIHTWAAIVESSMRSALGQLEALTTDATTAAARRLRGDDGWRSDLGALICASGCSSSQFRRRFVRQTELSPKCYARLCRLTAVIGLMERAPEQSWADCAQAAGCFDQAHLTHDFRQPMRITPSRFLRQQQLQLL